MFRKLFHSNRMRDWRPAVPQAQVLTSQPQEEERDTEGKIDHQLMLYSHSQNNFHPPRPQNSRGLEKWVGSLLLVPARFCHLNTSEGHLRGGNLNWALSLQDPGQTSSRWHKKWIALGHSADDYLFVGENKSSYLRKFCMLTVKR